MRSSLRRSIRGIVIVAVLSLALGVHPASAQPCNADPRWVTSPSLPDFNAEMTGGRCIFFQYAWQSFLYLTSPAPGGNGALNFETYLSVADVFGQGNTLRASANTIEGPVTLFHDKRLNKLRRFQVRGSEPFDDIVQAGSEGVLVDQNGNVTYYEQYLDPIATSFITSCGLTLSNCQTAPAAANLRFPAGAIELKLSWRPIPKGSPKANTYYTLENVEVFNPQANGGKGENQTVNLGLVGFHVVYTTASNKEMVWATFEHIDNAPNGPCTMHPVPPPGFNGWAFNDGTTNPNCAKTINYWTKGTKPPYPVTQAVRNYGYGSLDVANIAAIQALNIGVAPLLPPSSLWSNYFLVGAVWTIGDNHLPAVQQGDGANVFGSRFLSNSTIETFTQLPNPMPEDTKNLPLNCFACHNAEKISTNPPKPPAFMVSHVFFNGNGGACPYSTRLPPACANTQKLTVQLMPAHAKKAPAKKK